MNIIILGAEGQVGSMVQEKMGEDNFLICIDISYQKVSLGEKKLYIPLDITNHSDVEKAIKIIEEKKLKIDSIINLIGENKFSNFYKINRDEWNASFNINLTGFVFFLKSIYLLLNKSVSIVSLASQNGVVAHENRLDYGTFKAAMIHLVKNLTIDFLEDKSRDIKINCISPSYIITEQNKEFFETFEGKKLIKKIPLKKAVEVEDIIYTIEFLLSDKSKSIRGQNIILDYGYTLI